MGLFWLGILVGMCWAWAIVVVAIILKGDI